MTRLHATFRGGSATALALAALTAAAPVAAQQGRAHYIAPYIELGQGVATELAGGNDDVVTYTSLAAGVDAGVSTSRTEAQVSYRYERRFSWQSNESDQDIHSGLARASAQLSRNLSVEGGAIATRTRGDIRGAAPGNLFGSGSNVQQVYSLYAGPTFNERLGDVDANLAYRIGYTKAEANDTFGLVAGQRPLDVYDSATSHLLLGSLAVPAERLGPVGVTVSGAYEREDAHQLDQRYEGYYGRGDVVVPVSRTVAVRGGVGYEKIVAKQRDVATDANGTPIFDGSGRYVTDPNSPQRIAYRTDGLIYDAGVIWRPNPRLELQANAGWRYGGETYFGSLSWAASQNSALNVVVYDSVESFGRQLRDGISALPTRFQTQNDPFGTQFAGCVFGAQGGAAGGGGAVGGVGTTGAGGCLNDVFQSVSTANYRARGVDAVFSFGRGRSNWGVGGGYANRRLYAPDVQPGITLIGIEDQSAYAQLFWSRELSRVSAVDLNLFGNWYSSGLAGADDVYSAGVTGSYSRSFGRLGTSLSAGVFGYDQRYFDTYVSAQALLAARYTF